jgi:hypothetical protein
LQHNNIGAISGKIFHLDWRGLSFLARLPERVPSNRVEAIQKILRESYKIP